MNCEFVWAPGALLEKKFTMTIPIISLGKMKVHPKDSLRSNLTVQQSSACGDWYR